MLSHCIGEAKENVLLKAPSGYRSMAMYTSPKHLNLDPHSGSSNHRPYDRVHENWATSEDRGSLTLREFISAPDEPLQINSERLVRLLGDAQHDSSEFGRWVFNEASVVLANIPPDASYIDNNDFSHTAKYLFCAACFRPPLRSVLDQSESLGKAAALVDRAVSFCEMSQSLGTVPLIIRGVIASNMRSWNESGDSDSFYFRPESLRSETFFKLLQHASEQERVQAVPRRGRSLRGRTTAPQALNEKFCAASSPKEFMLWAFAHKLALPAPELTGRLKTLLVAHLGERASHYAFLAPDRGEGSERSQQVPLSTNSALEFRRGIYVDVFGTLINHNGTPNHRLAQVVKDLMNHKRPRPVFLVSDSQHDEVARALSFMDERPPLIHKDSLYGSELEYLIDNSDPEPQGLHARVHLLPGHAVQEAERLVADTTYFST